MKRFLIATFILAAIPQIAAAQSAPIDNTKLDIVDDPICFAVRNEADYTVFGSFMTDFYHGDSGYNTRHRSNFRLEPDTGEEYCTYGPFLPNRQLTLTIRTLFPVFECNTRVDSGEIVIKGERKADDSGVITWAECYRADGSKTGKPDK